MPQVHLIETIAVSNDTCASKLPRGDSNMLAHMHAETNIFDDGAERERGNIEGRRI